VHINEALSYAKQVLLQGSASLPEHINEKSLRLDAEVLLSYCLEKPRSFLLTWPEHLLNESQVKNFKSLIEKRSNNFPIAYLIGSQEFWSLNLIVNPDVLIPRPETECLVEFILEHFKKSNEEIIGLDLGTGSGAISLALASEHPNWKLVACDYSEQALLIAKQNIENLSVKNVKLLHSNWFQNIHNMLFDFIVSNPPYVENNAKELNEESIQFEPRSALCSGEDGLNDIKIICSQAATYLKPNSLLIIEHGASQAKQVKVIFEQNNFNQVQCLNDYSNLNRFTIGFTNP